MDDLRSQMSSEGLKTVFRLRLKTTYRSSEVWKRCQTEDKLGRYGRIGAIVHN
jgi:hypothetical protein